MADGFAVCPPSGGGEGGGFSFVYSYKHKMISDNLNIISKFTLRRGMNAGKVLAGYYYSKWTKTPHQWGSPISIAIEPTTSCNLRCPECPSGLRSFSRPTGMLNEDTFKEVIDELSPVSPYLIMYFQGEPYLNKQFFEYVKYASCKKMYVATSTNAHYLT